MEKEPDGWMTFVQQPEKTKQPDEAVASDQWDEKLRGKKMSSNDGLVIFKYQMPVMERFTMKLPKGAEILRVADQGGMFWLWAVVDTRNPDEDVEFVAVKCGANVPEGLHLKYVGHCAIFVQQELALYIFRVIAPRRGHRSEVM